MISLEGAGNASEPAGKRLRQLLDRPGILQMPGAHNGIAAIKARDAGFEALYLSGAAMSASMGLPDLGIITVDDVLFFIRQVVRSSNLPLLVDGDTGYCEALNVMSMVRAFEEAGAAAVQIEDQLLPKKCGHLNDKRLASTMRWLRRSMPRPAHGAISSSSRAPMPLRVKGSKAWWRVRSAIWPPAPR